jgi:2,6-dihydroxypyridine 3-monooxygenase
MIDLTDSPFIQVVFDLEVPRMVFGQICLIGDAALLPAAACGWNRQGR